MSRAWIVAAVFALMYECVHTLKDSPCCIRFSMNCNSAYSLSPMYCQCLLCFDASHIARFTQRPIIMTCRNASCWHGW
uniref:Hypothetical secreted protein 808 n=1 Tax=Amblyomma variegatum TaxID=34610 RepID=F0JA85_AMBVA|nr:TPA_inf: hypothetical secreted protein 808 [Amblyomma variegatum]